MAWHRLSLIALAVLAGCAVQPQSGTAPGVAANGNKMAEALNVTQRTFEARVQALQPETSPLHGKARIVVPDQNRLRPLVAQASKSLPNGSSEFVLGAAYQFIRSQAEALTRSNLFESASTDELNDTVAPDIGNADYLVWYQVRSIGANNIGPWAGGWFVKRAGVDRPVAFGFDPGVAPGTPQYASLVKGARAAATQLGGPMVTTTNGGKSQPDDKDHPLIGTGSGIVIDAHGHVLTNDHVIRTCGEIRIRDAAETSGGATVEAHDATNDLALLKAAHLSHDAARLRDSGDLRQGEGVTVIGYPLGEFLGAGASVVTGSLTKLVGLNDDSRMLQVSAPVQPGNSGGPLVDSSGNLIGVVSSTLNSVGIASAAGFIPQNINFAIKSSVVRSFLDANRVGYAASTGRTPMATADIADAARKFTVRIECRR